MPLRSGKLPGVLPFVPQSPDDGHDANLRIEYQEVCNNFRTLTDIRFRLLAFLPVGTAAGVALTVSDKQAWSGGLIGLFGLVVTFSVAFYNARNDQLYDALVARAAELERCLGVKDGAFAHRPRPWRRAALFRVEHGQIWWVYWASASAWLFTVLHAIDPMHGWLWQIPGQVDLVEAIVAAALVTLGAWWIGKQRERTRDALKDAARDGVRYLASVKMNRSLSKKDLLADDLWKKIIKEACTLRGRCDEDKIVSPLLFYLTDEAGPFYWDRPDDGQPITRRAAAQLMGLVTDMPPRWILDVASGRR